MRLLYLAPQPSEPLVAIYDSETNAAEYHGVYQAPLRAWLEASGCRIEVIGDAVASDPQQLRRFAAVYASSVYLVPDAAQAGLRRYVAEGGSLIWFDSPARCADGPLTAPVDHAQRPPKSGTHPARARCSPATRR